MKKIGVLNLQGAVSEHFSMLAKLEDIKPILVKHPEHLKDLDGLIIPGGESTAISRLIQENGLYEPIQQFAKSGKGIFGTCAGLVLCGTATTQITQTDKAVIPLKLMDIVVERNGFGRQVDSFETMLDVKNVSENNIDTNIPAVFIRAPYITSFGESVTPLAYVDNHCVMAQSKNILICSFHPELTDDLRIMEYYVDKLC